jgi:hypothetical protein
MRSRANLPVMTSWAESSRASASANNYRAAQRGGSTRQRQEVRDLRERAPDSVCRFARGSETLQRTRTAVVAGWHGVARQVEEAGAYELAEDVQSFVGRMPPPTPDQMQLVTQLRARSRPQRIDPMERAHEGLAELVLYSGAKLGQTARRWDAQRLRTMIKERLRTRHAQADKVNLLRVRRVALIMRETLIIRLGRLRECILRCTPPQSRDSLPSARTQKSALRAPGVANQDP